jgi:hypothetical protein
MSKTVTFGVVLLAGIAGAWSSPKLRNVCNSAPAPGGTMTVQADIENVDRTTDVTARLFYSTDNQATWAETSFTPAGRPGFDSTFEGAVPVPPSGTLFYYIRASNGTNYGTQGPTNPANTWPPPAGAWASVTNETWGDTVNSPRGPWLDMTGVWFSRSADRMYARITNNYNSWPLNSGLLGPWYIYAAGLGNPDYPGDTFGFAMAYANVLGIYTTGLYVVNKYTEDFTKFADIDAVTDGNVLQMRCRISDLAAHPKFGPWPPPSGFLSSVRGDTRSARANLQSTLHDTTNQARWYVDRTPEHAVGTNRPPVLDRGRVVPEVGAPETEFYFSVRYTDPDTNLARQCAVIVDDDTFELVPVNHYWWQGVTFATTQTGFEVGEHEFHFTAWDGMERVETVPDSFLVVGTALAEKPAGSASRLRAEPNPFGARTTISAPPGVVQVADVLGRVVRAFRVEHGAAAITWDGRGSDGRPVPPGLYFLRRVGELRERLRLVRVDR